jgi:hypothetical protein
MENSKYWMIALVIIIAVSSVAVKAGVQSFQASLTFAGGAIAGLALARYFWRRDGGRD